jgi:hypothetical protein
VDGSTPSGSSEPRRDYNAVMSLYVATLEGAGETNDFIEEGDDLVSVLMVFQDRATRINKLLLEKWPDLDEDCLFKVTGVGKIDNLFYSEEWVNKLVNELVI